MDFFISFYTSIFFNPTFFSTFWMFIFTPTFFLKHFFYPHVFFKAFLMIFLTPLFFQLFGFFLPPLYFNSHFFWFKENIREFAKTLGLIFFSEKCPKTRKILENQEESRGIPSGTHTGYTRTSAVQFYNLVVVGKLFLPRQPKTFIDNFATDGTFRRVYLRVFTGTSSLICVSAIVKKKYYS